MDIGVNKMTMPSLKEQISIIDEEYLLGISNLGIFNRSQKELESSLIKLNFENNTELEAIFADNTIVKITGAIGNFKCSCPSRTICKHVIMALLKASENSDAIENKSSSNFDYLLLYTQEALVKEYGKTFYNDVLFKIISGESCDIEESSILNIKLKNGLTIRFLPGASLSESICSCKIKNCRHRLEGIIQYIKYKTGKLEFELIQSESDVDTEIIPQIINFLEDIFRIGLIRLPAEFSEKCSQFAVLCHGAGFAVFERLFETCGKELALYEQKSAGFNKDKLLRNLTRIYQICTEIQSKGNENILAGRFKRQYLEMPKLRILGMGAYPWYAKSGFCGVTAVFFAPELKQIFNFSSSRPVESEERAVKEIEQIWRSESAWNLTDNINIISKGEISLLGAKASDDGRLSSSENTAATLLKPQADFEMPEPESYDIVHNDFSTITNLFSPTLDGLKTVYAVLKISKLGKGSFNKVTQTYTSNLIDKFENSIPLTIKYSKINETAILNFEFLEKKSLVPDAVTVSIAISNDSFQITVFPIAVWINGVSKNIGESLITSLKQ
jgi:hypothetical protein